MTRGYRTAVLTSSEYGDWDRLVSDAPEGGPYHATDYLDALCRSAGGDFRLLGVHDGETLVGGTPLYERQARTGTYVEPRLLLYYNGVVLRNYDTRYPSRITSRHLGMMEALERGISRMGYAGVELRCRSPRIDVRPFLAAGWRAEPSYTYVVPISDPGWLWDRIDQNLRRLVDRARAEEITMTEDDDFESYFRLHRTVSQQKGAPLYLPFDRYRRYFQRLRDRGLIALFHARLPSGRSISSQLVLMSEHPVTHTVSAAADPDHYDTGATPFLRWRVFETLSERGFAGNDLTDASLGSVSRFKRQLGSDLHLSLVLKSQRTPAFGLERRLRRGYWRTRDMVADAVRRIGRRVRGSGEGSPGTGSAGGDT